MHDIVTPTLAQLAVFNPGLISMCFLASFSMFVFTGCTEIEKPSVEPFVSRSTPPERQEFRWSNGRVIKSFDPALATSPPETDLVRALFEGLTQLDPKTLNEMPAAAEKWTSSDGFRTWSFSLRKNMKWSDGAPVTAHNFVRSWKRLADIGDKADGALLTDNIVGMRELRKRQVPSSVPEPLSKGNSDTESPLVSDEDEASRDAGEGTRIETTRESHGPKNEKGVRNEQKFGAEAVGELVLKVSLVNPDRDFPKLVAHPMFYPVAGDGSEFRDGLRPDIVTNGAFRVVSTGPEGVTLERSDQYWDRGAVLLERVRFVPIRSAESALQAYRAGELDALTNAEFEPLALKLLAPYEDFRETTHNALNLYEFNLTQPPFTDRRVREALTIAVERERLTEGEMKGAPQPAIRLLPFETSTERLFDYDVERARKLLVSAGFPGGNGFPVIRLVVNRNDTQQRIARAVARMWKTNLNIETQIVVMETNELDAVKASGNFDLIRRGVVFPTADRNASMAAIFSPQVDTSTDTRGKNQGQQVEQGEHLARPEKNVLDKNAVAQRRMESDPSVIEGTLEDAVYEFRVVPLYFPVSYSLIKPYVHGFETNGLDAPSLKTVVIDSQWQPQR